MKIRVIGGGLFGCTAAIIAARAGHEVELHEQRHDIMQGASTHNQFRLHRGYHYPRSPETGRQCRKGNESFMAEYGQAVITPHHPRRKRGGQVYAIALDGSKTPTDAFEVFCRAEGLPATKIAPYAPLLNPDTIDSAFHVLESSIDPVSLVQQVRQKLTQEKVSVHLNSHIAMPPSQDSDCPTIVATYTPKKNQKNVKYQIVEKPVLRLPRRWRDWGVVVMDGGFCCVDPLGVSGLHVLGHVTESVHWEGDYKPDISRMPQHYREGVNAGIVCLPHGNSLAGEMWLDAIRYLPFLSGAEHVGSFLTVRCVIDAVDDARPTVVFREGEGVVRIFSGKLGCCVDAAVDALRLVEGGV